MVPITAVAHMENTVAPTEVDHDSQFPTMSLSFNLAPGATMGQAQKIIGDTLAGLRMPGDIRLDFTGDFANGQMILQREFTQKDGTRVMQRIVWKNISANEIDWSWEASRDGGKTWQVNWPIHYKRKA